MSNLGVARRSSPVGSRHFFTYVYWVSFERVKSLPFDHQALSSGNLDLEVDTHAERVARVAAAAYVLGATQPEVTLMRQIVVPCWWT